jgi:hypothetical protein
LDVFGDLFITTDTFSANNAKNVSSCFIHRPAISLPVFNNFIFGESFDHALSNGTLLVLFLQYFHREITDLRWRTFSVVISDGFSNDDAPGKYMRKTTFKEKKWFSRVFSEKSRDSL